MQKIIQPVILAVIRKEGKYLVTLRTDVDKEDDSEGVYNAWQLPGGGLEFGEDVEVCLRRECREEIGVEIDIITIIPKIFHEVRKGYWHGIMISFLCEIADDAVLTLNKEASEFKWMSEEDIAQRKTLHLVQDIIREAEKIS